ncbi:MAG: hypothetical protein ACOH1E_00245 [Brevundimonas sp.]
MIDTLNAQIAAAVTVVLIAFALLQGDESERTAASAYALGWFASLLIQGDGAGGGLSWGLAAIDLVLLGVYAALAWKSRRAWPAWAAGLQSLAVMSHLLIFVDIRPPLGAFYAVVNLAGYGILLAIVIGTWLAWQDRRAAGQA